MKVIPDLKDERIKNLLKEIKKYVYEVIGDRTKEIILYGSYARNEYDNESDIDIMILADDTDDKIEIYGNIFEKIVFNLSIKYNIVVSVFIKSYKHFYRYVDVLPFYMNVQNEGIMING